MSAGPVRMRRGSGCLFRGGLGILRFVGVGGGPRARVERAARRRMHKGSLFE